MIYKFKYKNLSDSLNGKEYVWKLEKKYEGYLNNGFKCISGSNATVGIMASLSTIGLNDKDTIISAPFSFGGTIAGAMFMDLPIIFGDFDKVTFSLCPKSVDIILREYKQVKAVIDVDFLGIPSRSREIAAICQKYNVLYILDCANSFGTINSGFPSGYYADIAIFSLGSQKNICAGEGGIICIKSQEIYDSICVSFMHPDRQKRDFIIIDNLNQFSLNLRIHPYGAFLGYKQFSDTINKIVTKQRNICKQMPFLKSFYGIECIPNFNYILINVDHAKNNDIINNQSIIPFCWQKYLLENDDYFKTHYRKFISYIPEESLKNLEIVQIL